MLDHLHFNILQLPLVQDNLLLSFAYFEVATETFSSTASRATHAMRPEQSSNEENDLRKKKKTRDSFAPAANVADYFPKKPQPTIANPSALDSTTEPINVGAVNVPLTSASELVDLETVDLPIHTPASKSKHTSTEVLPTPFNDPLGNHACPPLSQRRMKTKTTVNKDQGIFTSVALQQECVGDSTAGVGIAPAPSGFTSSAAADWSRAPSGVEGPTGNKAVLPPLALRDATEEKASEAEQKALTSEEKATAAEQKIATAEKEAVAMEDRASSTISKWVEASNKSSLLAKELSTAQESLAKLEKKEAASSQLAAELQAALLTKDEPILMLDGKVVPAKSLLDRRVAEANTAVQKLTDLAQRRKEQRDRVNASRLRIISKAQRKLGNVFVSASRDGFKNCLNQVSVYQSNFSREELAATTSYLKVVRNGLITKPNDDDDPDLSFPILDVDIGSDGEGDL
ncbi:hypothetical protein L6164_021048 [Bauhinia variegata]|uniref:Uncharacterized protein n=1 Tax=Bauhinia variegata TaxID=167791 RepID=A0ACB9MZ10_BAUVA|nr:hypothetical protein L6164_021048 [Bauhinia variegata]